MHDQGGHNQVMSVIVTDTLMGLILMQPRSQGLSVVKIRDGIGWATTKGLFVSMAAPARISTPFRPCLVKLTLMSSVEQFVQPFCAF